MLFTKEEDAHEAAVDPPGFKKDELSLELNKGYLTLSLIEG